jgi:hypothetical protein
VYRGLVLGIVASLAAGILGSVVLAIATLIGSPGDLISPAVLGLVAFVGLGTVAITLIPAGLGGCINGLVLYQFARAGWATFLSGVLVGGLLGGISGYSALEISMCIDPYAAGRSFVIADKAGLSLLLAVELVSVILGSWHGWRIVHYLRKYST